MQIEIPIQFSSLIKIYIRLYNGNGCLLKCSKNNPFTELINLINLMDIQLPSSYLILFKGFYIKDYSQTLSSLGIIQNSILHIESTQKVDYRVLKMDINIAVDDQKYILEVNETFKISKLKEDIYKLTKINPKNQLLAFNGKQLINNNTLIESKIVPNSLICLIYTNKQKELSSIDSDYEHTLNLFFPKEEVLLDSVLSMDEHKKTREIDMFRSDRMDKKKIKQLSPIQIEIHHHHRNSDESSTMSQGKDFEFDLFNSLGMNLPMNVSIDKNVFQSLRLKLRVTQPKLKDSDNEEIDSIQYDSCEDF